MKQRDSNRPSIEAFSSYGARENEKIKSIVANLNGFGKYSPLASVAEEAARTVNFSEEFKRMAGLSPSPLESIREEIRRMLNISEEFKPHRGPFAYRDSGPFDRQAWLMGFNRT